MWQAHLETACCSGSQIFQESRSKIRALFPVINRKIHGLPQPYMVHVFANVHSFSSCLPLENRPFLAIVMAESLFETHDEDSPVTSTPVQESVYSLRKKEKTGALPFRYGKEHFFCKGRSAVECE